MTALMDCQRKGWQSCYQGWHLESQGNSFSLGGGERIQGSWQQAATPLLTHPEYKAEHWKHPSITEFPEVHKDGWPSNYAKSRGREEKGSSACHTQKT